jgi:integrase
MKLTDTFVKRKQGNGKAQKFADGGGLFLYISPKGAKSWRLAYRYLGKHKLLVIGPYPAISLKEARERREAAKKLLVDNIDPSSAKREAKITAANAARNSFETVAREWFAKYSAEWSAGYKYAVTHRQEKYLFPLLAKRPIKSITAPELLEAVRKIESRGSIVIAHFALSEAGRVFRYAIATGRAERDVAADLRGALTPRNSPKHFAAVTEPKLLGKLLLDIDSYRGTFSVRCALRLAPFVFLRPGELAGAEWSEIDFEKAEWRIPTERMKMNKLHIVPLPRQALSILEELRAYSGQGRFVFVNRGQVHNDKSAMNRVTLNRALRKLGYTGEATFHGFRATASTLLNELGYNRDWIERQLAHGERDSVRAAYNHAAYLPERRKMMQNYADYLTDLKKKARKEAASPSIAPAALPVAAESVKGKALRAATRP